MTLAVQPITARSAVQQCLRVRFPTGRAFNQPKFCPIGTWNPELSIVGLIRIVSRRLFENAVI